MNTTEAHEIIDTHEHYGVDALWSNYPDLETIGEVLALYEAAWSAVEDPQEAAVPLAS